MEPAWLLSDVLGWLMDRDPAQFGRIVTQDDLLSAIFCATFYRESRWYHEQNPRHALLNALQSERIVAYQDGAPLPADFWLFKEAQEIRADLGVRLLRIKVLAVWPDLSRDPTADSDETQSLAEVAERWTAHIPPEVMSAQNLAAALLAVVCAGGFEIFQDPKNMAFPPNFDPRLLRTAQMVDQNGEKISQQSVLAALARRGDTPENRWIVAHDIRVPYIILRGWWWLNGGSTCAHQCGLLIPWFVGKAGITINRSTSGVSEIDVESVPEAVPMLAPSLLAYPEEPPSELVNHSIFAAEDWPLLKQMRELLIAERVRSIAAAARKVKNGAKGAGTADSKAKRLATNYVKIPWDRWEPARADPCSKRLPE